MVSSCYMCVVHASSAAGGRTVWPCPNAVRHVDEPVFTGSHTWSLPLMVCGEHTPTDFCPRFPAVSRAWPQWSCEAQTSLCGTCRISGTGYSRDHRSCIAWYYTPIHYTYSGLHSVYSYTRNEVRVWWETLSMVKTCMVALQCHTQPNLFATNWTRRRRFFGTADNSVVHTIPLMTHVTPPPWKPCFVTWPLQPAPQPSTLWFKTAVQYLFSSVALRGRHGVGISIFNEWNAPGAHYLTGLQLVSVSYPPEGNVSLRRLRSANLNRSCTCKVAMLVEAGSLGHRWGSPFPLGRRTFDVAFGKKGEVR